MKTKKISDLKRRPGIESNSKLQKTLLQLEKLLAELEKQELNHTLVTSINKEIVALNSIPTSDKNLRKQIIKGQTNIIKIAEKELKLVPKNYYRNL